MDRDKALDLALKQIQKQFGEGAVIKMGAEDQVKVAAIPTGALSLDLALGIGGLPRGRVVEIFGPESSGKCLTADTYVWTDHGLETIAELFARCGQEASCTSRITDVRDQGIRLVNEQAQLEGVAALTHNDRRPVRRITLRSGRSVEATDNHPFRVLSDGWIVWKNAGEIEAGDVVVSALFGADEAIGASDLSEDEAVLLGYLIAEGGLDESIPGRFSFADAADPDVVEEVLGLCEEILDVEGERYGLDYHCNSKRARELLRDRYELDPGGSADEGIPHCVRTAGAKVQAAFLSALYEGDGWIEKGPEIGYVTASRTLAEQLQLMLHGFGIPATRSATYNGTHDRDDHTVLVGPAAAQRFLDTIGFRSVRRAEQVAEHAESVSDRSSIVEYLPGVWPLVRTLRDMLGGDPALDRLAGDLPRDGHTDCSRQRLQAIVAWADERLDRADASARGLVEHLRRLATSDYTFERVTAVEDAGRKPTFDVSLPRSHSFVANGVLSHNSTLGLHVVAEAQKLGGIAAFIDAEHALDPVYARAIGVDVDELLVSQPDTGEQALEITDMLVRSSAVDIIVIDSVAALVPKVELEGEMGDAHVGLQARLMSQALRKVTGSLSRSKTCCVFINQLREKIGVMFGCASGRTRVTLADGSHETIADIVDQKLDVEVLSYDPQAGRIVPKRVTNWFDNGPTERFTHLTIARAGGGTGHYESHIEFTPNHRIMTPGGWREVQELSVGDRVIQSVPHHLSEFQWEVLLGGLMGDSALSTTRSGRAARLRWGHGEKQAAYGDWKASLFANVNVRRTTNDKGAVFHDVQPLAELAELRRALYFGEKKVLSHDYLKRLTPLSIAIWYMDDGSLRLRAKALQERTREGSGRSQICVEALEPTSRVRLQEHLRDTWGLKAKLGVRGKRQIAYLVFPKDETEKLHALIAPYVHPSMDYKLLPKHRGRFSVEPEFDPVRFEPVPMEVLRIDERDAPRDDDHRYDIEVEGTHNYFADGVMVHNSPETTPGGRALKFYSSVRLDVRRIESLKDGQDFVGNRVRVKVAKNKCLAAGTKVFDPTTGLTHTIEEIVDGGAGTSVWAADKKGRMHIRPITARMNQGEQEVIGLTLDGGTELKVTPDHRILTEHGWVEAGDLAVGDLVARPRRAGTFGEAEPITADHARLLGYLVGGGYVGGGTPIGSIDVEESLHDDVATIASGLGCDVRRREDGLYVDIARWEGEEDEVVALTGWAGSWGDLSWDERIPAELLHSDVTEDVLANLLFGLWETGGWISRDRAGGVRCGLVTTSEQLAWQVHWSLLRWGITSSVQAEEPGDHRSCIDGRRVRSERPCWQVRVSGIDDVRRFAEALPMWGPKGRELTGTLDDPALADHRGSRAAYLPVTQTRAVLAHLAARGVGATLASSIIGLTAEDARGGMRQVLGPSRLRRDRVGALADALDDAFLRDVLGEEVYYDRIHAISAPEPAPTYDIEVDELHNLVADGVVVHNCGPPFKRAEFDIIYSEGISKEGSILDVGVESGIVTKAGAWYSYEDEQLGQGRENARQFLKEHDDIAREIEKRAKEELGIVDKPADEASEEAEEADAADDDADDS